MDFDYLMPYDYDRVLSVSTDSFDFAMLALGVFITCVIACVKEFKINSVETVREASQEPNLKIATYVKRKTIKSKTELNKHSVTIPQLQFQ